MGEPKATSRRDDAPSAPIVLDVAPPPAELSHARAALVVAAAALLPYLNTLRGGFVFDDHELILANPMATPGMAAWEWFLRQSKPGAVYRPITMLTYALDGALGGTTFGFHLTNVLIHVAASLAAFALAAMLLPRLRYAVVAAVLFAVHPVHTEAVANLAGRSEVLAGGFALLAMVALLRFAQAAGSARWAIVMVVSAMLGVFSKESAAAMPLLGAIVLWWRRDDVAPRRAAVAWGLLVAVTAAYLAARWLVVGALGAEAPWQFVDNPLAHVPIGSRLATALVVVVEYLGVLTVPLRLSADETFDQVPVVTSVGDVRLVAAVAVLALAAVVAFRVRRRVPGAWYGLLFGMAALAVTANVFVAIGTIKGERLLYLPSFGWCLACAALATTVPWRTVTGVVALVALLFAGRTWVRNDDWHDDFTLFTATAVTSPNSVRAQSNAAAMYAQRGDFDRALVLYENAVQIYPGFVGAQIGRGRILAMHGRTDEALAAFELARHSTPPTPEAHLRAGDLRLDTGDPAAAERTYRDGLAVSPRDPELLLGLALADVGLGRRDDAIAIRDDVTRDGRARVGSAPQRLAVLAVALGEAPTQ